MANKVIFCEFRAVKRYLIILRINGAGLEGICNNYEINEMFFDNHSNVSIAIGMVF